MQRQESYQRDLGSVGSPNLFKHRACLSDLRKFFLGYGGKLPFTDTISEKQYSLGELSVLSQIERKAIVNHAR